MEVCLEPPPMPHEEQEQLARCTLRRCQGQRGCLCVRVGPYAEQRRVPRPVTSPERQWKSKMSLDRGRVRSRPAARPPVPSRFKSAHEVFAQAIGIDLEDDRDKKLEWIVKTGAAAPLPNSWQLQRDIAGCPEYMEKATGKLQRAHPLHNYYRQLAIYTRRVLAHQDDAELQPEPEPQARVQSETEAETEQKPGLRPEPEPEPELATQADPDVVGPWCTGSLARGFSEIGSEQATSPKEVLSVKDPNGKSRQKNKNTKKSKGRRIILNSSGAKSSRAVMRLACAQLAWCDNPIGNDTGDIFWTVTEEDTACRLQRLGSKQRLARIPGVERLTQKRPFALLMRAAQQRDPESFRFWPQTLVFPDDPLPKASVFKQGPLIYKPSDGCQGDGITIIQNQADLAKRVNDPRVDECVVQRYLPKPLLLDGMKFDIRLYALVTSLQPLRVFACREGLVRVCTKAYEEPTAHNSHQLSAHLTNYSVNKYEPAYQHDDDPADGERGSKRSLPALFAHLSNLGYDAAQLERSMHEVVSRTCSAMAGALTGEESALSAETLWEFQTGEKSIGSHMPASEKRSCPGPEAKRGAGASVAIGAGAAGGEKALSQCFQILGFDIMFCEAAEGTQQAYLLEVNSRPSLAIDSVFPVVGPHACVPHEPVPDAPWAGIYWAAMDQLPYKGVRHCLCRDHHRPHLHAPCAVDLVAKQAAVCGALRIVRRQTVANGANASELVEDTAYVPLLG